MASVEAVRIISNQGYAGTHMKGLSTAPTAIERRESESSAQAMGTPWRMIKARVHVSLAPQSLNEVIPAATRQAYSNLLLRYNTNLGGVVAAIKGSLKLDGKPKIVDASPFIHVSATATMLLFSPKPKCVLEGTVNYVGPDHVGMSVHSVFHAVLPIDDAAPFYHYAGAEQRCWKYQFSGEDDSDNEDDGDEGATRGALCSREDIYMGVNIRFRVTSVKSTKSGLFQVLATIMQDVPQDVFEHQQHTAYRLGVVTKGGSDDYDVEDESGLEIDMDGLSKQHATERNDDGKTEIDLSNRFDDDDNDRGFANKKETGIASNGVKYDMDNSSISKSPLSRISPGSETAERSLLRGSGGFGSALTSSFTGNGRSTLPASVVEKVGKAESARHAPIKSELKTTSVGIDEEEEDSVLTERRTPTKKKKLKKSKSKEKMVKRASLSEGNAKVSKNKVDLQVDNDEDENISNISGVLKQLEEASSSPERQDAVSKADGVTLRGVGEDDILVPETQEEEVLSSYAKHQPQLVTQVSQSKKKDEANDELSEKLKKKKIKKRSNEGSASSERPKKRKRESMLASQTVEGKEEESVEHEQQQRQTKKRKKKRESVENSAVELDRRRRLSIN